MQKIFEKLSNPLIFIIAAAFLRILPHVPNFAPIGAMALFSGTYLDKKSAFALPLTAMVLSDLFIGFDGWVSRLTVYGSFALITLMGFWLRNHRSIGNILLVTIVSSILFFLTTNFGVWAFSSMYPRTLEGLTACFVAAIPFFRNSLAGDLFYTTIFFGGYELIKLQAQSKKLAKVEIGAKND